MYTSRVYSTLKEKYFTSYNVEIAYNGRVIGYLNMYSCPMAELEKYVFVNAFNTYYFDTLKDVFTALRMLKDICK